MRLLKSVTAATWAPTKYEFVQFEYLRKQKYSVYHKIISQNKPNVTLYYMTLWFSVSKGMKCQFHL